MKQTLEELTEQGWINTEVGFGNCYILIKEDAHALYDLKRNELIITYQAKPKETKK